MKQMGMLNVLPRGLVWGVQDKRLKLSAIKVLFRVAHDQLYKKEFYILAFYVTFKGHKKCEPHTLFSFWDNFVLL